MGIVFLVGMLINPAIIMALYSRFDLSVYLREDVLLYILDTLYVFGSLLSSVVPGVEKDRNGMRVSSVIGFAGGIVVLIMHVWCVKFGVIFPELQETKRFFVHIPRVYYALNHVL